MDVKEFVELFKEALEKELIFVELSSESIDEYNTHKIEFRIMTNEEDVIAHCETYL